MCLGKPGYPQNPYHHEDSSASSRRDVHILATGTDSDRGKVSTRRSYFELKLSDTYILSNVNSLQSFIYTKSSLRICTCMSEINILSRRAESADTGIGLAC